MDNLLLGLAFTFWLLLGVFFGAWKLKREQDQKPEPELNFTVHKTGVWEAGEHLGCKHEAISHTHLSWSMTLGRGDND